MAANIDAVETGSIYGIDEKFAANYVADSTGMDKRNKAISSAMKMVVCDGDISDDWKKDVEV